MGESINKGEPEINIFDNLAQITEVAQDAFMQMANETVKKNGQFNVAVSGGKTPVDFYKKISQVKNCLVWHKTHIFLVDDRFVSFNNENSNYKLVKENLCDHVCVGPQLFHFIPVNEDSPQKAADVYEESMKEFFKLKDGGLPRFDLIMLGLGEDGHTASIFSGDPAMKEEKRLVVSVSNKMVDEHDRVTITLPVINNAKCVIMLANGTRKAEALKKVLEDKDPLLPATHVKPTDGELIYLIDREAASLLTNGKE